MICTLPKKKIVGLPLLAAPIWGRTGFDGDMEAGIAGGCA